MANNTLAAGIVLLLLVTLLAPTAAPLTVPLLLFFALFGVTAHRYDQASDAAWQDVETQAEAVAHTATWGCGGLLLTLAAVAVGVALLAALLGA